MARQGIRMKRLKSQQRRGRWFHYFRWPNGKETPLIHGVEPDDPQLVAAWAACNAECERTARPTDAPKRGSVKQGLLAYMASPAFAEYAEVTRKNRSAVYKRLMASQGDRPLGTITPQDIQGALAAKSAAGGLADFKAMRSAFAWLHLAGLIGADPTEGVKRPTIKKNDGYPVWDAAEVEAFQARWPRGTRERLMLDLALYTGQRRADLCRMGWQHVRGDTMEVKQSKTGSTAYIPMTQQLREALEPAAGNLTFLLTAHGRPFSAAGLGNAFRDAAAAAGVSKSLHGLRKAFCIYWAEKGRTTYEIAAMSGHTNPKELEPYTRAADRQRMVRALAAAR